MADTPSHSLESLQSSHSLKEATEEQVDAAITDEDIQGCAEEAWIHEGDLSLVGDLDLYDGGVLIVTGDLAVEGSITTDETATLVVGGNLTGRHLYLEGNLEVHGNATLRGVVYGFYEAGLSYVYGRTKAKIGLIGNHCWGCDDEVFEIEASFENYGSCEFAKGDADALCKLMGDENFTNIASMLGLSEEDPPDGNAAWGLGLFDKIAP